MALPRPVAHRRRARAQAITPGGPRSNAPHNLEKVLGVKELYIKDDSANYPTWSYKERVVSVAITKAIELGYDTVGCASTGNLANSVAAHAAQAGLKAFVMIPARSRTRARCSAR